MENLYKDKEVIIMTDNLIRNAINNCYGKDRVVIVNVAHNGEQTQITLQDIAALINRQQAEVEKLELLNASLTDSCDGYIKAVNTYRAEIERLTSNIEAMAQSMPTMAKADRAEAVKEFAELLKSDWIGNMYYCEDLDITDWIDNLVKEMVGEG